MAGVRGRMPELSLRLRRRRRRRRRVAQEERAPQELRLGRRVLLRAVRRRRRGRAPRVGGVPARDADLRDRLRRCDRLAQAG